MENSSVYMCFPCYQEFNTLDEVLQHQLTCTAEATEPPPEAPGMTTINAPPRPTQVFGQLIAPAESIVANAVQTPATDTSKKPPPRHAAASAPSDQPRILYQCGDCDMLFKSLDLWQQHRKEGSCLQPDNTSKPGTNPAEVEVEVDPDEDEALPHPHPLQVKAEPEQQPVSQPGPDTSGPSAQPGPDETGSSVQTGSDEAESSVQPGSNENGSSVQPGGEETGSSAQPVPDENESSAQTSEEAQDHAAVPTAETKQQSAKEASADNSPSAQNSDDNEDAEEEESPPRRRGIIKKVKPEALLLCVDCGTSFGLVSELVAHRKSQHGLEEALHRCFVCGESFLNTTLFLYHRKQHQQKDSAREVVVEEIVLDAPEQGSTQSNGLEEQSQDSSATTAAATTSSSSSSTNTPNFTQAESFLCTQCGDDFINGPSLAVHRVEKHGLPETLHHCSQCDMVFMNTTRYLYHRRLHRPTATSEEAGALTGVQGTPRKRLLSPANALSESVSPSPKRGRPYHTGTSPVKEEIREPEDADRDSTNLPPPAKLLQDWARTSLPHVCPHCGKTFTRRVFLRAHVFSHTGEKLFTCKVCKKSFSNSQSLLRHSMNHMGTKPYHCELCGKNFTQATNLRRHQRTHVSGDQPRKRGRKPRVYTLDSDSSTRLFPCTHCPSRFNTEEQLNHHKLLHTTHPFPCPECGVAFKRRKELDLHSLSHQDKEPATCEHCNSQFINQSVLDIHLQRCATNEQDRNQGRGRGQGRGRCTGQVECDLCGHRCMTQEGLDLHRLSHTGQTPLKCPVTPCRRRFASSQALEEHMVAHIQGTVVRSKGRPRFSCDICLKEFAYTSTFNVHMRTHTDERPFECSVCSKRFRQLPHLQDHERIHSGVRPFSCWVCGKSFSVAARLTEHARTHSGEKPYPCPHCNAAFRSRSNLDKHLRLHGDLPQAAASAQGQLVEEALKAAQVAQVQRVLEGATVLTSLAATGAEMEGGNVQTIYVLQSGEGTETMMIPSDQLGMVEGTNQVVILPSSMLGSGQTITVGGQEITMVQQAQSDEHGAIEFIVEETV